MMKVEWLEERRDERVSALSCSSMEQVRSARRVWRGDRGYNDELMVKMKELEELLTAHKMASSSWRSRAGDLHERNMMRESTSDNAMKFDGDSASSIRDDQGCSYNTKNSEGSRGRLYEKYMKKRDAKLREEWGLRRVQKEAKMKSMWDSLERSRAEMKARFGGSADGQDLVLQGWRHAEKLKSFGARSATKETGQEKVEFIQTEEENPRMQVLYVRYKFFDDTLLGNGSSSRAGSKKLLSSRIASSSISQNSVAPIPRPPVKSGSIRRRTQPESPSAQSVSNNSNHRKENMKPFTGTSKITRSRMPARSRSINEGMNIFKEEKPPRSRSIRSCSVNSGELKDLSSMNTGSASLTPSRFSKERSVQTSNRFQKISESKPFLRRGNGISRGARAFVIQKNGEESEGLVDQSECFPDTAKHKDEQCERTLRESRETGFPSDSDGEKPRSSQESGSSGHPRPDNGDGFTSVSQADEFEASAGGIQELPEENSGSWNSHIKYPFSDSHEAFDVNASVDTPTSFPASWNSHPMNQTQKVDSTRVRKKWVKAEKLVLVTTASHQPRNGVAEGFKRLFRFGKKSKGAEDVMNDLVSVSTASDVHNDIENGHDLANQSLDDLRKLRMEYSVPAYHGLNEGKVFPYQVLSLHSSIAHHPSNSRLGEDHMSRNSPNAHRLLFSLPSFLSKGSESKLR